MEECTAAFRAELSALLAAHRPRHAAFVHACARATAVLNGNPEQTRGACERCSYPLASAHLRTCRRRGRNRRKRMTHKCPRCGFNNAEVLVKMKAAIPKKTPIKSPMRPPTIGMRTQAMVNKLTQGQRKKTGLDLLLSMI